MNLGLRWLKFNAVGLLGIGVQLAALQWFVRVLAWNYLIATAAAVETAVLHNFCWHAMWTWRVQRSELGDRLLRFHLGNGLVSILANLGLMRLLHGLFGLPLLPANLLSIAVASLANFAVSEFWVFAAGKADTPVSRA